MSFAATNESPKSYFWPLPYSQGVATAGSAACLTPDALPDATPKGFVSPPGIKARLFHSLGKCEPLHSLQVDFDFPNNYINQLMIFLTGMPEAHLEVYGRP